MNHLPVDPFMLCSVLNTKLRDQYDSLERLCEDMDVNKEEILKKLQAVGFEYNADINQFR